MYWTDPTSLPTPQFLKMENNDLIKRAEDLCRRCEKSCSVTMTGCLSPAERFLLEKQFKNRPDCSLLFSGGHSECERTVAFFLPEYMEPEYFDPSEYICAMKLTAHFGTPGHRDYMGAILGMGVGREWVGDIWVDENTAYVFCLPSVQRHLLSIDKAGRVGIKAESIELEKIPAPKRQIKEVSFSVMSMRLDAVTAGMFNLSRTEAAKQINQGNVSFNYQEMLKTDCPVSVGDIISLRGSGKGKISGTGGNSRKGRLFVYAEIYK